MSLIKKMSFGRTSIQIVTETIFKIQDYQNFFLLGKGKGELRQKERRKFYGEVLELTFSVKFPYIQ